jgi:hypothetical protein
LVRWWLLLLYKIPAEPSAARVSAWRKLKRLGAILLNDATWILPSTPWTQEQLQWLAAEIREHGGEATVWEARLADGEDQSLADQFLAQVDAPYADILADLRHDAADLAALARRYQQVKSQDYLRSSLGERVREALLKPKGGPST